MDASRFDRIAKVFAARGSRRSILGTLAALAGSAAGSTLRDASADHGCIHPGNRCDPDKPGRCCSKRCSAKTKTCLCTKAAQCPAPTDACKRAVCKRGRCRAVNRTNGTPCGTNGICDKGVCTEPEPTAADTADAPPVALGIFQPGVPADSTAWNRLSTDLGRLPAVVMWYQHWGLPATRAFDRGLLDKVTDRGAVPMITWEPWDPREGLNQPDYRLHDLCTRPDAPANEVNKAQEANNAYVDSWAEELAGYGKPVLLRFAHEMNGTWYPWAAGVNDNTASDYVTAWRCLRERFAAWGADNVLWVWSPNVSFFGSKSLESLFPGEQQVDWLGLDGYNWGGGSADWQTFEEVFGDSLRELEGLSNKPVMIAETSSAEAGGSKASWIRSAMLNTVPLDYPQVRAFVWFNEKKERNWRFDSSDEAHEAFRTAAAHPYYQGTV